MIGSDQFGPESGLRIWESRNTAAAPHVARVCLFTLPFLQWVVIPLSGAMWRRREGIQEGEGGGTRGAAELTSPTAGRTDGMEKEGKLASSMEIS